LIEMQKQMIELIQRNAHTERECAALREQLARELESLARPRHSLPERLWNSASGLLQRLLGRNDSRAPEASGGFAIGWSQPFDVRSAPSAPERSDLTS
jgi:hypothetical protein